MIENRPKVGLAVYIIKDKKLLLLKRKGSHGGGSWNPPGGHLEMGESFIQCARRETKEEAGIEIKNIQIAGVTNDIFNIDKHYITVEMMAELKSGTAKIMEADKATDIGWFELDKLPKPLFLPVKHFLKDYQLDKL